MSVGEKYIEMDVVPFIENERTFVPLRFVAENLGYKVDWDEPTQTVTITERDYRKYFKSIDECALDWSMKFNNWSIGMHKELGSSIYHNENGYYYTFPNVGESNDVFCSMEDVKVRRDAVIHSHASTGCGTQKADRLSSSDLAVAKTYKCDNYVATPCGKMEVYRYNTGKVETISMNIPYDRRALNKLQTSWGYGDMKKNDDYFKVYDVGTVCAEADFYNKLFLEGKKFPLFDD